MGSALVAALVGALVAFALAHGALLVGLALRRPRWRALVALAALPLAPYWGWRAGMRRLALTWALSLAVYTVALVAAAAR